MTGPRRRFLELTVWSLAAVFVAVGLLLGGVASPKPLSSELSEALSAPQLAVGTDSGRSEVAQSATRAARFKTRLAEFSEFSARFWGAFAPPTTPRGRRQRVEAGVRVARAADDRGCLAQAVYYEARGEPEEGQAGVAQVVLNRMRSGAHPATACGVVFEGAAHPGCQFSFACDPRLGGRRRDPVAWARAQATADAALGGREVAGLQRALNYHADYVRPSWSARLRRMAEIGRHIFYAPAPAPLPAE